MVSQLLRQALSGQAPGSAVQAAAVSVGGFRPFAARGAVVSDDRVNALRDAEGVWRVRALLDVNVLIALLDAAHLHHRLATAWLQREIGAGWASCPLTQNGCIRILFQPAYPGALAAADVAQRLGEAAAGPAHQFWPDDARWIGSACWGTDRSPMSTSWRWRFATMDGWSLSTAAWHWRRCRARVPGIWR